MSITDFCIKNSVVTWTVVVVLLLAGLSSYFSLGKLEDPNFTVKTATITTTYAGAGPEQVDEELTEVIALAVQEIPEVDYITTTSYQGLSVVKVEIKPQYWSDALPQIWDTLRRKIRNIEGSLPQGAGRPDIGDDFGDIYGFVLAITGDDFTYKELEEQAKNIKRELSLVDGVARVEFWGKQKRAVYVKVSESRMAGTGISAQDIANTITRQNKITPSGNIYFDTTQSRIEVTGEFASVDDIGELIVRGSNADDDSVIRIKDIATVEEAFVEPQTQTMRYDGKNAIGLSVSNVAGSNIITLGANLDAKLVELQESIPVGIDVEKVAWQADEVTIAINNFIVSLGQAIAIVLVVLTIAMGWRMGVIIGTALILTIDGTLIIMNVLNIDLHRMSLGALIIALGMMVDNAIVVADGMVVRMQRGMDRVTAASKAAVQPSIPLLGATVIAVLAFYPIGGSPDSTGEYCLALFQVVGISLLFSWLISITVTPLQCVAMIPDPKESKEGGDPYSGGFFKFYKGVLNWAIKVRYLTMVVMTALLIVAGISFGFVSQLFFPDSSRAQFMVDMYAKNGTRIAHTSELIRKAEDRVMKMDGVESVSTFIGSGPPWFYLPVEPEKFFTSYAQLIVTVDDYKKIDAMKEELATFREDEFPEVPVFLIRKFAVGPSNTWPLEIRLTAPSDATNEELRAHANEALAIVEQSPFSAAAQLDWRDRTPKIVVDYNQERGRWAGVSRSDVADSTSRAFDGQPLSQFREKDELLPVLLRNDNSERENPSSIYAIQVPQSFSDEAIPLTQVSPNIKMGWQDTQIFGRDRKRVITIQGALKTGVTMPDMKAAIDEQINEWTANLPLGYTVEWGGEIESSADAQKALAPGILPSVIMMFVIIVALFNGIRPAIVIFLTVPFALIGVTSSLLLLNASFGFMALLGAMSLAGMMIKNSIVLIDEIKLNNSEGQGDYESIINAGLSRLRPVALAAATTVLGVVPLLQDVFWVSMAVTIMGGLAFGTILTMIVVPVLYSIFYRIPSPSGSNPPKKPKKSKAPSNHTKETKIENIIVRNPEEEEAKLSFKGDNNAAKKTFSKPPSDKNTF